MQKIAIIGFGFTGTICAIHLIEKSKKPLQIFIIEKGNFLNTGIAYRSYSERHLLNVIASKMSAFSSKPNHFVEWILKGNIFPGATVKEISDKYVSRNLYGRYINEIWSEALEMGKKKNISVLIIKKSAIDIEVATGKLKIKFSDSEVNEVDKCILATGNELPADMNIKNKSIFNNTKYFKNPWDISSVRNLQDNYPILIVGNGLTMTDTVIGLLEQGTKQKLISLSTHGFNILPHIKYEIEYKDLIDEWQKKKNKDLRELICLFNHHLKILKKNGFGPEPLVDSLRPHSQEIWQNLNVNDKKKFMSRVRHLWGVARHRIPQETYKVICQLQSEKKLEIIAAKITDIFQYNDYLQVEYINRGSERKDRINVSRIINCTGPQTDIKNSENTLLKNLFKKGWISQDTLNLGINSNVNTLRIIDSRGIENPRIFTLAGNLKGMLWETTAINEIRNQALKLSELIDC